jgi:NitT/TauT family transport system permease protein
VNPIIVPPFSKVMTAWWHLSDSGVLWKHVSASLRRAVTGFAIAAGAGIVLGLAIGWIATARIWLAAPLEFFRQIPPLAIFPVFLLLLGLGFHAQVAMVVWAAVWPIMLNTINGCQQVDPSLVKAARSFGMSRRSMFAKVVLPSALPMISTGLRLGGTYALLVLVGAEMVGAQSGIGYLIISSQYALRVPDMYAGILTIAVLGLILNFILIRLERYMSKWREHGAAH